MKTKDLIAALQDADPTGEVEVCVGNQDIYFVEQLPAYYDGRLQTLIVDNSPNPRINGVKVHSSGNKVQIHIMGVEDVLLDDPDATIDLSDLNPESQTFKYWTARVEKLRKGYTEPLQENITMSTTIERNPNQSRFGFHPCDYATYRKLKRLNFFAQLSKRLDASWQRWNAKQPQNRFLRETKHEGTRAIRGWALDANGNRIPWLEPVSVPGKIGIGVIEENYKRARYPVASADLVKPLTIAVVDKELQICEEWYAKQPR
jgi:hypothetical protein